MNQRLALKNVEYRFPAVAYWKVISNQQIVKPSVPRLFQKEEFCCNSATD